MNLCRHCKRPKVNRPRGLCWTCWHRPDIRELYPSSSKYAHRGTGKGNRRSVAPDEPTEANPGTDEKITAMARRAALNQALHHPGDSGQAERAIPVRRGDGVYRVLTRKKRRNGYAQYHGTLPWNGED